MLIILANKLSCRRPSTGTCTARPSGISLCLPERGVWRHGHRSRQRPQTYKLPSLSTHSSSAPGWNEICRKRDNTWTRHEWWKGKLKSRPWRPFHYHINCLRTFGRTWRGHQCWCCGQTRSWWNQGLRSDETSDETLSSLNRYERKLNFCST